MIPEQIDVKNLNLHRALYKAALTRFKNDDLARAVSQNFYKSGLSLIVEGAVKIDVTENLEVYAEQGKIKGVSIGLSDNVQVAYANEEIFRMYVPTNKAKGATLVTIKYND
jgi:hypothetical protein|tara:strand:- start:1188 stop:1520 length:333 start_codon:yes stop_codon:yes gene_type:complete